MMTEQSRPDQLVRDLQLAEQAGSDFSVCSDSCPGGRFRLDSDQGRT